jgi:hypothetical protein
MKRVLAAAALLLAAPFLTACGSGDDGDTTAVDPGSDPGGTSMPTEVPAAPGTVDTRGIVTVMDTGTPELCLGPVAESYPPQCGGPAIEGWDWSRRQETFESQGGIRWGQFAVSGTWDGTTLTLEAAIPAAVYDAMPEPEPAYLTRSLDHTKTELEAIAQEVAELPGAQGAYAEHGRVLVDVTYDDGSLQDWADETYGEGVVVVSPMLLDREV